MSKSLGNKPGILLIGNFLSGKLGTRSVSEELSDHLRYKGWKVITVSNRVTRISRLYDMAFTTINCRDSYDVAAIEVLQWQRIHLGRMLKPVVKVAS